MLGRQTGVPRFETEAGQSVMHVWVSRCPEAGASRPLRFGGAPAGLRAQGVDAAWS